MTHKLKLTRRSLLVGATGVAIALPWLEAMSPRRARAEAPATSQRFVAVYQPGGTVLERWRPTGDPNGAFELSRILAPLAPVKDQLVIVDGLAMKSAAGENHQAGLIALLTGGPQLVAGVSFANSPSLDQAILAHLGNHKAKSSLHFAVRWATGRSHGLLSPINALSYENDSPFSPIPPRVDPLEIFDDLFAPLQRSAKDAAARRARKKSILDYLDRRYASLSSQLGAADRSRLDQHLTKIREIEKGLAANTQVTQTSKTCRAPTLVDTSDYNPHAGTASADDGSVVDMDTDAAIPKVGKLMMDMLVMALACDMTAVATLQWADTEAKHTFPWLGLAQHHHFYQHDGGYHPVECEQIATWYSQQHSYLLQAMAAVDMGGHSLLDESTVFFGTEIQYPATHAKDNMPLLVAGKGGNLRTGRWMRFEDGGTHNDLLLGILRLFGDTRATFGTEGYCTGPLAGFL